MNRFFHIFNATGALLLAVVCGFTWQVNRRLNLKDDDLLRTEAAQTRQLEISDKTIKSYIADLEEFRQHLATTDANLKLADDQIKADKSEATQLRAERDRLQTAVDSLKASLDKWMAAVADRDLALDQARDQIVRAAADRNEAVRKFNDLAQKYNQAEGQLKQAAADVQKLLADRNDAVARFNDLVAKYNALAKPQTRP